MAGRIPQAFIDDLVARADIVETIGTRVPLKKAGREYRACCPFHDEKTPSFWVSPDKQFYHCFGCGAHGTVLGFLMEYDRLSFPEAVEELAERLGLTVPHDGTGAPAAGGNAAEEARLHALLSRVADFYQAALAGNDRARAYAQRRGLQPATLERFRIGYAPDAWNEVLRQFGASEGARADLLATGLAIERDRSGGRDGCYDRFRDRLMFPIRDTRGRVIAFGGRVLDQGEPKYLNSPETALFHKGRELYGLYETRLERAPLRRLLVVEGYMDTVQLHQAGVTYAVATLGTATTAEHLRRAFRLVNELVFCFDGDRAGRAAAWRALQNVLPEAREGRQIRFLFLPEGEDPDSLVAREGRARFESRLADALPLSEYLVTHLAAESDLNHADGKANFVALARPLLEKLPAGVYRELLLERVGAELKVPAERVQQWLSQPEAAPSARNASPAATRARASATQSGAARRAPGRGSLITQAITLLLHFPAAASAVDPAQRRQLAQVPSPGAAVLLELLAQQTERPTSHLAQILERWRERHEYRRLCELAAGEPLVADAAAAGRELREAVARLLDAQLRQERQVRLETLIRKADESGLTDPEKQELQALTAGQTRIAEP